MVERGGKQVVAVGFEPNVPMTGRPGPALPGGIEARDTPSNARASAGALAYLTRVLLRLRREKESRGEGDPLVQQLEGLARTYALKLAQDSGQAAPAGASDPLQPVELLLVRPSTSRSTPGSTSNFLPGVLDNLRQELAGLKSAAARRPRGLDRMKAIQARIDDLDVEIAGRSSAEARRSAATRTAPTLTPIAQDRLQPRLPGADQPGKSPLSARVAAVAFGPKGGRIAVAGGLPGPSGSAPGEGGGLLGIWDPQQGSLRLTAAPDAIRAVAFAPDGRTLVTGEAVDPTRAGKVDPDGQGYESARLRDAQTGRIIRGFRHGSGVVSVAVSPDGRLVATGSQDGRLSLFDADTGRRIGSEEVAGSPNGPPPIVAGVGFAADGRVFAWMPDGAAGFWGASAERGLQRETQVEIRGPFNRLALAPDGRNVAVSAPDGSIRLVDVRTGSPHEMFRGRGPAVSALVYSPEGGMLATAGLVGTETRPGRGLFVVTLWDVASLRPVAHLEGAGHRIGSVAFAPDGRRVAAGCADGAVSLWDLAAVPATRDADTDPLADARDIPRAAAALPGGGLDRGADLAVPTLATLPKSAARDPVDPVQPASPRAEPDGPDVASRRPGTNGPVRPSPDSPAADPPAGVRPPDDLPGPVSPRRAPEAVAPAGDPFAPIKSGENAGGLAVGRRALPDGVRPEGEPEGNAVLAMATAPDGRVVATGSEDGLVRVIDPATKRLIRQFEGHTAPVRSVAYSRDGRLIASAASDQARERTGEVLVRNIADGSPLAPIDRKTIAYPLAVAFSPDGATLAVGTGDGRIILRRLPSEPLTTLNGHHGKSVRALAFAPDGKTFASGGDDGTVEVWKREGTHVETVPGTGKAVVALAYSPDGKRLAAGSGRFVIVHDGSKPGAKARTPFVFHQCEVLSVAFSPDGRELAAAGGNVDARDGLSELERKILQLEEAKLEKQREVTRKRNMIAEQQSKAGLFDPAQAKDRNTVWVEEYRQLANELLRVQIEMIKAEAELAGLQNDQPAADGQPFTEKDYARIFYADKRVVAIKERYDRARERFNSVKERVRDFASPEHQKPLKDMEAAKAELDSLYRELRPEIEAMVKRGAVRLAGAPDKGLKAAEGHLAALKAQEASLTDRLNTLNIKQRADGAAAVALEFSRLDLSRAEQYLDTINRSLAELRVQAAGRGLGGDKPAAEAFESLAELRVWDVATTRFSRGLIESGGWIGALAFSRDGSTLIAGGGTPGWSSGFVTLFDLAPRPAAAGEPF